MERVCEGFAKRQGHKLNGLTISGGSLDPPFLFGGRACNFPEVCYTGQKRNGVGYVVSRCIVVAFAHGLHVRPAAALVSACRAFDADVMLKFNGNEYNLKSVLGIVGAGIKCGDVVELVCSGKQENEAMEALMKVLENTAASVQ